MTHPSAVAVVVKIFFSVGVSHSSWVTSDDVKLGSSNQSGLCVPLDLNKFLFYAIIIFEKLANYQGYILNLKSRHRGPKSRKCELQ